MRKEEKEKKKNSKNNSKIVREVQYEKRGKDKK